jgi:cobalt/nickel transport system permease protein
MVLIFAFSFVQDLRLLPVMIGITVLLYLMSGLPWSFLASRLRYPGFFILALAVVLPLTSGSTPILQLGPLTVREEGCWAVLLIVTRFGSILTVGLMLFGTAPFLTSIKAMRALGLPAVITDMILLAYRYLFETGEDLMQMWTAMRLRGYRARRPDPGTLTVMGALVGSLLVRSYERAERVYKAMRLRGYGRSAPWPSEHGGGRRDTVGLVAILIVAAGFVAGQAFLQGSGG